MDENRSGLSGDGGWGWWYWEVRVSMLLECRVIPVKYTAEIGLCIPLSVGFCLRYYFVTVTVCLCAFVLETVL